MGQRSDRRSGSIFDACASAVLFLATLFLFIPILHITFIGRDEQFYAVFGRFASRGYLLYRDSWEIHFPGLYYLYAFCFAKLGSGMVAVRSVHLGVVALSGIAFYFLMLRFLTRPVSFLVALALVTYNVAVPLEGQNANTEPFVVLFLLLAVHFSFHRRTVTDLLAGVSMGLSILFKQHAIILSLVPLAIFAGSVESRRWAHVWKRGVALLCGILATLVCVSILLAIRHAFRDFWGCTVTYLVTQRLGEWNPKERTRDLVALGSTLLHAHPFVVAAAAAGCAMTRSLWRRVVQSHVSEDDPGRDRILKELPWILVWTLAAGAMTVLSGRAFPHYLLLVVPPLCCLAGIGLQETWKARDTIGALAGFLALLVLLIGDLGAVYEQNASEFVGRYTYRAGEKKSEEEMVGDYVRSHSQPDEGLFVWGPTPGVYYFADRKPSTRFVNLLPIVGPNAEDREFRQDPDAVRELQEELRSLPRYIVTVPEKSHYELPNSRVPWLSGFLQDGYVLEWEYGSFQVFARKGPATSQGK